MAFHIKARVVSKKESNDSNATPLQMFLSPFHRSGRLRRQCVRLVLLLLFVVLSFDFILTITVNHPLIRVSPSMISSTSLSHKDRIFIASMHWNNELIIRSHWSAALLDLVSHFGAENVYISIIEGGSWDDTKGALRDLDLELEKMGVERSIEMHESTHKDEIERIPGLYEEGWIWTSRDKKELRRIPYLAGIRNQVMNKLRHLAERTGGQGKRSFDKILWLNDVIFTTEDVTTLIATRDGNYAAACSLDFSKPPLYYDTFALRDVAGAKAVTQTWPIFLAAKSRNAMISNSPVPVKSCWNGLVVFQADPFYHNPPLRFRGIPDSLALHHLEGSECCLIHADNWLSSVHGVWLNPNVRVSYNPEASTKVHAESGPWPGRKEKFVGIWNNRWARWTGFPRRFVERYVVDRRIRLWQEETHHKGQEDSRENGTFCLINEMQVLVHDGWAHV